MTEADEQLNKVFAETVQAVEDWLEKEGEDPRLFAPRAKLLRLLILRTWAMRLRISISELLTILVPVLRGNRWDQRTVRHSRTESPYGVARGLGVPVHTLTSRSAYRVLCQELVKRYPYREEISAWREREKERQIEAEDREEGVKAAQVQGILEADSAQTFAAEYVRRVERDRERMQIEDGRAWRKRKNYRSNPFR